ncbi:MAG: molybdopterin-dependent oxidoreductase, partial [Gemmatimonadota bacterium]|nr:molybdopterin-dependent oxidoreductase [Gemmatimonadota bacterium]
LPEEIAGKGWGQVLELIPLTVYHGANSSATTEKAHMVFPAAAFAEREGTVTNFASRVQIQRRAFAPLGQALPGWEIVQKLGNALGGDYKYLSAPEVFDNLALECKAFRGLSYEKIGSTGITAGKG